MSATERIIDLARTVERASGRYPRFLYMDDIAQRIVISEIPAALTMNNEPIRVERLTRFAGMIVMPFYNCAPGTVFVAMEPL